MTKTMAMALLLSLSLQVPMATNGLTSTDTITVVLFLLQSLCRFKMDMKDWLLEGNSYPSVLLYAVS